jgi:hypothetical protein
MNLLTPNTLQEPNWAAIGTNTSLGSRLSCEALFNQYDSRARASNDELFQCWRR